MTHHMIMPGGGISLDGARWVHCRPGFLLPVRASQLQGPADELMESSNAAG
jgi:hypothetical protein